MKKILDFILICFSFGFLWTLAFYFIFMDFKLTYDSTVFFPTLVGGIVGSIIFTITFLFCFKNSYLTLEQYVSKLETRLIKHKKFNLSESEFPYNIKITTIDDCITVYRVFLKKFKELDNKNIQLIEIDKWYLTLMDYLIQVQQGNYLNKEQYEFLYCILNESKKIKIKKLHKLGLSQYFHIINSLFYYLSLDINLKPSDLDTIDIMLYYYYILLTHNINVIDEFYDFIDDTIKKHDDQIIIDIYYTKQKEPIVLINILKEYIIQSEDLNKKYYLDFILKSILHTLINKMKNGTLSDHYVYFVIDNLSTIFTYNVSLKKIKEIDKNNEPNLFESLLKFESYSHNIFDYII